MHDLEHEIQAWRQRMRDAGVHTPETLDELEGHLRDDIEAQMSANADPRAAFALATQRLGTGATLRNEFRKAGVAVAHSPLLAGLCSLAGIPQRAAAGGAVALVEPAWATYARAALFALPALLAWMMAVLYLVPKLQHIALHSAMSLPEVLYFALFCSENAYILGAGAVILLAVLELRTTFWARFRRACMGLTILTLNAAVLMLTFVLVAYSLLAASEHMGQSRKAPAVSPAVSAPGY